MANNFTRFLSDDKVSDASSLNLSTSENQVTTLDMFGIDNDVTTKGVPLKGRRWCRFTFVMMCLLVFIVYLNPR